MVFTSNLIGQNLKIDSDLKVYSTYLIFEKRNEIRNGFSSFDNKKNDSLSVSFGTVGVTVISLKIDFLAGNIKPKLVLWSDAPDFNGSHTLEVELISYDLTLNKTDFESGDIFMGEIVAESNSITDFIGDYQIKIKGHFKHIIGKTMIKRKAEHNYYIKD